MCDRRGAVRTDVSTLVGPLTANYSDGGNERADASPPSPIKRYRRDPGVETPVFTRRNCSIEGQVALQSGAETRWKRAAYIECRFPEISRSGYRSTEKVKQLHSLLSVRLSRLSFAVIDAILLRRFPTGATERTRDEICSCKFVTLGVLPGWMLFFRLKWKSTRAKNSRNCSVSLIKSVNAIFRPSDLQISFLCNFLLLESCRKGISFFVRINIDFCLDRDTVVCVKIL